MHEARGWIHASANARDYIASSMSSLCAIAQRRGSSTSLIDRSTELNGFNLK